MFWRGRLRWGDVFVVGMAASVLAACVGSGPPAVRAPSRTPGAAAVPSMTPSPAGRVAGWRDDLRRLIPGMEAMHPDLYHGVSRGALRDAVARLVRDAPTLDDDELMVGVLRIVAMVSADGRDGHTGAFVWGTGTYPVHSLPLRLWTFPDGVFVVDALPPHGGLVGRRVESVAGRPVGEVAAAIAPLVPRDNPTTVTLVTPRFLLIPEILHGLGLISAAGRVKLGFEGAPSPVEVEPIPMADYNAWAGEYGLFLPPKAGVRWLARSEEPLWSTRIGNALYVQYNRVEFLFDDVLAPLRHAISAPGVRRIVVDIRNNFGGETHAFPVVARIVAKASRGRTLAVITGRNTFSAASLFAARLERTTDAVFVGEPMGGSPNLYGNPRDFDLPFSGIDVSVATGYFVGSTRDDPRLALEPDVPVELTSADYLAGRDPALRAALRVGR
jgi:hypothetical protein